MGQRWGDSGASPHIPFWVIILVVALAFGIWAIVSGDPSPARV